MYGYDKYEEHLRDSAPCSSRFDGFDRGDWEPFAPMAEWRPDFVGPRAPVNYDDDIAF
jgi:hypothetical protein